MNRPAQPTRLRWWFEDADGEVVLAQPPNTAAGVSTGLLLVGHTPFLPRRVRGAARLAGQVATGWWAVGEVARGATPARRAIGALALVRAVRMSRKALGTWRS